MMGFTLKIFLFLLIFLQAFSLRANERSELAGQGVFHVENEFPNYFLSPEFRSLTPSQMQALPEVKRALLKKEVATVREVMIQALSSVFNQVNICGALKEYLG